MSHFPFAAAAALALGLAVTTTGHAADERGPAQTPGPTGGSALPSARTQDEDFLRTAPGLLAPEIGASKLGVEKGRDPQVVALSRAMVQSYTELERKLKDAARSAGHEVTDKVDPHGVHRVQRLEDTGPQFDLAYIDEQRGWHKKLVAIYSMEERAGQNAALKKHAEEGRALLAKNLEEIERLEARLREQRNNTRALMHSAQAVTPRFTRPSPSPARRRPATPAVRLPDGLLKSTR